MMPESTRARSHPGQVSRNSSYSLIGAESHDLLDAPAVVPAAIEEDDLAGGREMHHVALVVELRLLAVAGGRQRHDPKHPRTDPLLDSLDDSTLASRITSLKDDDDLEPFFLTHSCIWTSSVCRRSISSS